MTWHVAMCTAFTANHWQTRIQQVGGDQIDITHTVPALLGKYVQASMAPHGLCPLALGQATDRGAAANIRST